MILFMKEFFERVDFGGNSADNKNANNITLHAKSVSLKFFFFDIAIRCETAIKTNGPLYKHIKLIMVLLSTDILPVA